MEKILLTGSTGMLGKVLAKVAVERGYQVLGVARHHADVCIDIADSKALTDVVLDYKPDIVINAAAITNLAACESDVSQAYKVNARPAAILLDACRKIGSYFIQISTDHYFINDQDKKHDENAIPYLVNEYARTKYAAEMFALTYQHSMIVRTNIVGYRQSGAPTFVEWAINSITQSERVKLYADYYTSSISVAQFSSALLDLMPNRIAGTLNIACREVTSKAQFIKLLASEIGIPLNNPITCSVNGHGQIIRAESAGLDVSKAETLLGYSLPTTRDVILSLLHEYEGEQNEI